MIGHWHIFNPPFNPFEDFQPFRNPFETLSNPFEPLDLDLDMEEESWYCIGCGVDMGINNPRQYCAKTYCPDEQFRLFDEAEQRKKDTQTKITDFFPSQ